MLLCCEVAFSTKNLQLKQFNGNFDACICLVHLLPFYNSEILMDQPGLCVYRIQIFNAEKKEIIISTSLFLSVSDYSQSSLKKSTQHGTYDYLFNLTYFYSRDRVQVSEFLGYNEMANRYDRIFSCRILLFIYLRANLSCPSFLM